MPRNVIFLTGAPETANLDFDERCLISSFVLPIKRFLEEEETVGNDNTTADTQASFPLPKWRHVSFKNQQQQHQQPNNTHPSHAHNPDATRFLSFQQPLGPANHDPDHLNFLEHSLAILEDLDSSQIEEPAGGSLPDDTTDISSVASSLLPTDLSLLTSTDSLATTTHIPSDLIPEQQTVTFPGPITDLKRIPNAKHLLAIHPQTMTINVLASIISIKPPRTVRLRKRNNASMDIIEILLGDESRAGFSVSFWLPPQDSQAYRTPGKDVLRDTLSRDLRSGDALLVTNIALGEFQGNVYGQSLSRRITRNNTTVTVLSKGVVGLPAPTMAKLGRVREWASNFVGGPSAQDEMSLLRGGGKKRRVAEELPPDTQNDDE